MDRDLESIQDVRDLLKKAHEAQRSFAKFSREETDRVVASVAREAYQRAGELAEMAVRETGFGLVADKKIKNEFAAKDVYESIRDTATVGVIREDPRLRVTEIAVPMGIVAGIVPSTNPTSTAIFKALIALKGRNAILFSPHPAAKGCIAATARLLHDAAVSAGAPPGVVGCLADPTAEATRELMHHPLTAVILATGGQGLVKAAYSSGKPAFGVGPGNVPAFIERTADIEQAVSDILAGKCFDNGTVCASEQSVVVDLPVQESVRKALLAGHAHFCTPGEKLALEKTVVVRGAVNPRVVGQPAHAIASMAGFAVPERTTALVAELERVGPEEPLSMEKLSPVLGFYTVDGWVAGCERCMEILRFGGVGHSMSIHSRNPDVVLQFALEKPAFRILVNTPSTHGAIGYSTGLTPSLTLGCGAWGNNMTSDNLTAHHLVHVKRLAFGTRPVPSLQRETVAPGEARPQVSQVGPLDRESVRALVSEVLEEILKKTPGRP